MNSWVALLRAKKCAQALQKSARSGFTLVEILIVLGIFSTVIVLFLPRLQKPQENIKSSLRKISSLARETRNRAKLYNATYRMVFELGKDGGTYFVEKASQPFLVKPKDAEKEEAKKEAEGTPPLFAPDKGLLKEPKKLPLHFAFNLVETNNMNTPQTEGTAYIYFFPEGMLEAAVVQLTDHKALTWTLVFNPLTGQSEVLEEAKLLKDLNP